MPELEKLHLPSNWRRSCTFLRFTWTSSIGAVTGIISPATISHRLQYCDTVFYFDFPTITCLAGITKRTLTNLGKVRLDMGGNCVEHFDSQKISLYRNVLTFNKQHRKDYCELLNRACHANVIIFRSRKQANDYLAKL